jgi:hypothetical protein
MVLETVFGVARSPFQVSTSLLKTCYFVQYPLEGNKKQKIWRVCIEIRNLK